MSEDLIDIIPEENTSEIANTKAIEGEDMPERNIVFEEALEAVLFAAGHPVSYATLSRVFNMTPSKVRDKVFEYALKYNAKSDFPRGVMLLTYSDNCQLCTKEYYLPEIRDALGIRKSGSLSTAAMETLAVVAYNQPVTRLFVDTVRKVDSSYAMNSLIDRGLIECVGRLDVPGRPMQYGTTSDFLRCFGLNNINELPTATEDLIDMFEKVRLKEEEERASEPEQLSIEDMDNEASESVNVSSERNTVDSTEEKDEITPISDDDPSAEDDIVDID